MPEAIRNLIGLGASFEQAIDAATRAPARAARRTDVGSLRVGAAADVVVLDDNLAVIRVIVDGRVHA
jgi:N-acetylglucosamine-6-phosphate deacetylase